MTKQDPRGGTPVGVARVAAEDAEPDRAAEAVADAVARGAEMPA